MSWDDDDDDLHGIDRLHEDCCWCGTCDCYIALDGEHWNQDNGCKMPYSGGTGYPPRYEFPFLRTLFLPQEDGYGNPNDGDELSELMLDIAERNLTRDEKNIRKQIRDARIVLWNESKVEAQKRRDERRINHGRSN